MPEKSDPSPHITGRRDVANYLPTAPGVNMRVVRVPGGPRHGSEAEQNLTTAFVLNTLRRWWLVATPVGILLAGLAATAVYLLFEPVYEAAAWFEIKERAPYVAFETKSDERSKTFFTTQMELIRSSLVTGPVIQRPEIVQVPEIQKQKDKAAWLSKQIKVSSVGDSELFRILFASSNPADAAKVVNAITDAYFKLRDQTEGELTKQVVELLDQEKANRLVEVKRLRDSVRELATTVTGKDPFAPKSDANVVERRPLAELQGRLVAAQVELAVAQARLTAMDDELKSAGIDAGAPQEDASLQTPAASARENAMRDAMVEKIVEDNAEIQKQKAALSAKQAKLEEIETKSAKGKKDPLYQQLSHEVARQEEALEKLRAEIRPRAGKDAERFLEENRIEREAAQQAKRGEYEARRREELSRLKTERDGRRAVAETLEIQCKTEQQAQEKDLKKLGGDTLELQFKRDELARAEKVFEMISQRALQLQTERSAPARVSLLKPAEPPPAPVEVVPYRNMALGGLGGLLLPFGLAFLWERLIRRVGGPEAFEQQSQLPVLGEISRLPARVRAARVSSTQRMGQAVRIFEESIDSLRTSLTLAEELRGMKVLAVTSAANHEGKTSVAVQLAVSIARASGEQVLLVDGDMRSPDLHDIFSVPLEPGLAKVLSNECELEDAIVTSWNDRVHVLPAGKLRSSPHKLLGNGTWGALMEKIRSKYRYIVIDTPPVLAASEALVLAKGADASLLCVMRDVSRIDQVIKARERLAAAGTRPVGAVLNGVPTAHYAYRYGTYAYSEE